VRHYGFSDALGTVDLSDDERLSTETRHIIEKEVRALIEGSQQRAMTMLRDKASELDLLAEALITYESLNLDEVQKVLRGETLPDRLKAAV
jgi:ATP-dependent metalloprotease